MSELSGAGGTEHTASSPCSKKCANLSVVWLVLLRYSLTSPTLTSAEPTLRMRVQQEYSGSSSGLPSRRCAVDGRKTSRPGTYFKETEPPECQIFPQHGSSHMLHMYHIVKYREMRCRYVYIREDPGRLPCRRSACAAARA